MKKYLVFLLMTLMFWSCVEEVKLDENETKEASPSPCFQVKNETCGTTVIPMPSDFMYQAVPAGTELNLSNKIPFTMSFTNDIDATTLENRIMVFKDGTPYADITVALHPASANVLLISPKTAWPAGTYSVLLLKGIKTTDGKEFVESQAFYYSKNTEPLVDNEGHSTLSVIDDTTATQLEAARLSYKPGLEGLEASGLNRSNFLMLWNVTIKDNFLACFLSKEIEGCEQFNDAPVPSDFVMLDNHLNLPIADDADDSTKAMLTEINKLDGWGVTSPFMVNLSQNIDESTLKTDLTDMATVSVMVLKLTAQGGVPVPTEAKWDTMTRTLSLSPANGDIWRQKSTYVVVLTDKLKNTEGHSLIKPQVLSIAASKDALIDENGKSLYEGLDDAKANQLEDLRKSMAPLFQGLEASGIDRKNVSMAYTVTTQTVTDGLMNLSLLLSSDATPMNVNPVKLAEVPHAGVPMALQQAGITDPDAYAQGLGYSSAIDLYRNIAFIFIGNIDLANYLSDTTGAWDPTKIPTTPTKEEVKFFMTIPMVKSDENPTFCEMPTDGFPVIIVQHGLGGSKEQIFGFANKLAENCYVAIGIDAVEHGDRVTGGAQSGENFFSANLFASRDHLRQSVLDLVQLRQAVKTMADFSQFTDLPSGVRLDNSKVSYFGISLGGILGTMFMTVSPDVASGVLNVPGGGLIDILMMTQSDSIKMPIINALHNMGIEPNTPEFAQFLFLGQLILDQGDPIAYAHHTITEPLATDTFTYPTKTILMQKSTGDEVIPNYTTNHLAKTMNIFSETNTDSFKTYAPLGTYGSKHAFTAYNEEESKKAKNDFISFYSSVFNPAQGGN